MRLLSCVSCFHFPLNHYNSFISPQDECEPPDDECINQMIARTEAEFDFFQKTDVDRMRAQECDPNAKSRLMMDDDVPSHLFQEDEDVSSFFYSINSPSVMTRD